MQVREQREADADEDERRVGSRIGHGFRVVELRIEVEGGCRKGGLDRVDTVFSVGRQSESIVSLQ